MSDQQLPELPPIVQVAEHALCRAGAQLLDDLTPHGVGYVVLVIAPNPARGGSYVNITSNLAREDRERLLRFYADHEAGVAMAELAARTGAPS